MCIFKKYFNWCCWIKSLIIWKLGLIGYKYPQNAVVFFSSFISINMQLSYYPPTYRVRAYIWLLTCTPKYLLGKMFYWIWQSYTMAKLYKPVFKILKILNEWKQLHSKISKQYFRFVNQHLLCKWQETTIALNFIRILKQMINRKFEIKKIWVMFYFIKLRFLYI